MMIGSSVTCVLSFENSPEKEKAGGGCMQSPPASTSPALSSTFLFRAVLVLRDNSRLTDDQAAFTHLRR